MPMLFLDIEHQYYCFDTECVCCGDEGTGNDGLCECHHTEQVLRHYVRGDNIRSMTTEERQFLINDAIYNSKGRYLIIELEVMSDKELAAKVLYTRANSWQFKKEANSL